MQTLYDAGIFKDPLSGMPIFDPSACAPKLRTAGGKVLVDGREVNARQAKSRKRMRKPKANPKNTA